MCSNLQPIDDEEVIVYKIVARKKKGTRYYSIAMGFKYPKIAGRIPKIKVQHCLGHFNKDILQKQSEGYSDKMIGRTVGFVKKGTAEVEMAHIQNGDMITAKVANTYKILVVKAKLTDGLMSGDYGGAIIAGRYIEFLE